MEAALDSAPCFYFSFNEEGTLLHVNKTLCTRLGFSKASLEGQKADTIFTLSTRIFQQTHLFPLLKMQGHATEIFLTLLSSDKTHVPVLINVERREEEGTASLVCVGIEVPNRKKFEDELIAAKKAAEKALIDNTALAAAKQELQDIVVQLDKQMHLVSKQNEELRQFNKVVTHDLQEPLRKLSMFTDMMLSTDEKDRKAVLISKLMRVSDQMRAIVSGLQQYVWLTDTKNAFVRIDPSNLLLQVQQDLKSEFRGVSLTIQVDELPFVYGDPGQMKILFHQLLANVIRFKKPGSNVANARISAYTLVANKFRNVAGQYKYADFMRVSIADDGIGFDADYKHQAFELFRKLHPEGGSGIGLPLCRKIMENHEGSIEIDSEIGVGTTVTILLPMAVPQQVEEADITN